MAVASLSNIEKSYFAKDVLKDVNLTLNQGDKFSLVGENGSGKTTLMRILAGQIPADAGTVSIASSVKVSYLSQQMEEFHDLDQKVLNRDHLDRILKDLDALSEKISRTAPGPQQDKLLNDYQLLSESFQLSGGYSYESRLAQALAGLGLEGEILDRPIKTLSGGERMRALMARKLIEDADLLLLDEPTNHLDIDALEWLESYLMNYKGTLLLISHDRYFMDKVSNRVGELAGGKLTLYKGNYTDYTEQKKAATERSLETLAGLEEERDRQEEVTQTLLSHRKIASYHARQKVVSKLEDKIKEVRDLLPPQEKRMNFHFTPKNAKVNNRQVLIKLENATMAWEGQPALFEDVSLELLAGEKKVIVGPNGSGKTTLLHMLMGQTQNFAGDLSLLPGLKIGHLGQYTEFQDESLTLMEELVSRTNLLETPARNLLARFGFRDIEVHKTISVLSGGERARLYLCCLLEEDPDVLFLDEPTNHLDIHSREVLEDAILDYDGAVLAVSHDRYFIEKCGFEVLGFIDHNLTSYRDYGSYRHFANLAKINAADTKQTETAVKEKKPRPAATVKPPSPGKIKNRLKRLQIDLNNLENKIHDLEVLLEDLEEKMALPDQDPETYQAYADKTAELEKLYDQFFALGQEKEDLEVLLK